MWYEMIHYYAEKAKYSIKHMLPIVWKWCRHMGWGWLLCSISGRTRTQGTRLSSREEARRSGIGGFSSVQSLSLVGLFASPWTAAHQASLSITNSQSLLKLMSIGGLLLAIGSLKCFYVCYCMLLRVVCVLLLCVCYWVCVLLCMCSHGHRLLSWIITASFHC